MILRRDEFEVLFSICARKFAGGNEAIVDLLEREGLVKKYGNQVIETIHGVELLKAPAYARWFFELRGFSW